MNLSRETVKQDIKYYKRDFWSTENLKFSTPHYRMRKSARIVNKIAKDRTCELLDVGCGPATLRRLIRDDIRYYGVDIAIHQPAPYLLEYDFLDRPISFEDKSFDLILAQGVFEYVGAFQDQKFAEISRLLKAEGPLRSLIREL
jgi:SAM-dependent methyltransferase